MPIKHAFTSAKGDPGDTTLVKPSDWNTNHNAPPFVLALNAHSTSATFTDMPSALTEPFSTRLRLPIDLTYVEQVRLTARVMTPGATGAKLRIQYSTDSGVTWNYLDGVSGPSITIDAIGVIASSWVTLASGAKADVWLRLVGLDGDGAADPAWGLMTLQMK
jgi:hypothetical protein